MPVPDGNGVRKVAKPAPFSRPRIDMDTRRIPRTWREVPVETLAPGDTVPGVGTVVTTKLVGDVVTLEGPLEQVTWPAEKVVKAFTRIDPSG